jgi:hypothetical protein
MAYENVYEGAISAAGLIAGMNGASGAVVIPSANGQQVLVLQGAA